MAYVRKYRDKWRAEVNRSGQRQSKVFDTKREAAAWALEMDAKAKLLASGWRTFSEAAARYATEVSARKRGEKWELARLRVMESYLGGKELGEIDAPDIAAWRDGRLKTVSGSTVIREVNLLHHVFKLAKDEWRWMENDPFRGVKMPKANPPRTALWRWQQIKRVLRAGQRSGGKIGEAVAAFHISLRTGMRLKEVIQAPDNFNAATKVVTLTDTKTGRRTIPVGRIAASLIQRPSFSANANETSTLFAKLTRQLLIDGLTLHDARGTALTHLARKVGVLTLAKISGHRDVSLLSSVYYRETPEQIAARL